MGSRHGSGSKHVAGVATELDHFNPKDELGRSMVALSPQNKVGENSILGHRRVAKKSTYGGDHEPRCVCETELFRPARKTLGNSSHAPVRRYCCAVASIPELSGDAFEDPSPCDSSSGSKKGVSPQARVN